MFDTTTKSPAVAQLRDAHSAVLSAHSCFPLNMIYSGALECLLKPLYLRHGGGVNCIALPHPRLKSWPILTLKTLPYTGRAIFMHLDWMSEDTWSMYGVFAQPSFDVRVTYPPFMFDENMLRSANAAL